jgi:hypothetical protein
MVDAELHDGGSTSFTLVFLLVTSGAARQLHPCSQYLLGRI